MHDFDFVPFVSSLPPAATAATAAARCDVVRASRGMQPPEHESATAATAAAATAAAAGTTAGAGVPTWGPHAWARLHAAAAAEGAAAAATQMRYRRRRLGLEVVIVVMGFVVFEVLVSVCQGLTLVSISLA